jgi:hypothetical protein
MELVKALPEDLQSEVADFARFLSESRVKPKRTKLRQDWAGALSDLRDQYTTVELQHKILDWWVEAALDGCSNAEALRRELLGAGAVAQQAAVNPDEDEPECSRPAGDTNPGVPA